ncbi:YfgM family protein [Halopseudomonas sabulinigri]|uniref:Ancillary SecYEG translocon subunit n=1 Tax=Halopseudomonas sabulinigri TaxID=472181 RepID=A0A1H1RAH8_9GAMM|nr:tetratricopeptide repeat protein [Halopseudomonas sabulinigri]SDS32713.1 Putative negative regulator of RcsB-dependent stress response [Halopseudomonas sabulinigri]
MAYETEEEQVEKLKDMWRRHGAPLLTGVAIALAGVFGWQAWNNHQDAQARNASTLYQSMLESVLSSDSEASRARAAELAAQLREEYASTRYADYAALMQARLAVEAKDFPVAEKSLRDVIDSSKNSTLQEVARQRLARVLGQEQRAEEALELFSAPVEGTELRATREEIRGDLLLSLGRGDEARDAYKAAQEALPDASARPQLQLKLDDLAEEV